MIQPTESVTPAPGGQERIWAYFQNEGVDSFGAAAPRIDFLEREVSRRNRAGEVINIGIGDAHLEHKLAARGRRVTSLDPDPRAVAGVRSMGVRAEVGYVQQMPFADASADVVVASEVLEHLDEPTRTAGIGEIRRVLRPGGWFLGTVPCEEDLSQGRVVCPCCGALFHRWGHEQSFTLQSVRAMLTPAFEVRTLQRRAWVTLRGQSPLTLAKRLAVVVLVRVLHARIGYPGIYFAARRPRD